MIKHITKTKAIGLIVIIAVIGIFLITNNQGNDVRHSVNNKQKTETIESNQLNPLAYLPKPPLSCNSIVSIVSLSADYTVTNMGCSNQNSISKLICNGTIYQNATNVSLNCYRPDYYSSTDQVVCSGAANQSSSGNLTLNYSCSVPAIEGQTVYLCTGQIQNYASLAINLPINANCSS